MTYKKGRIFNMIIGLVVIFMAFGMLSAAVCAADDSTAEATTIYPVLNGETYSFINEEDIDHDVLELYGCLDYVIYDAEGRISKYEYNVWPSTLTVPAFGELVITSQHYADLNVKVADGYFTVEKKTNPVMVRKDMLPGDGYVFENISDREYTLHMNSYFDYVLYDALGNIVEYGTKTSLGNKAISAGGKIKFVMAPMNYETTVAALYDKFSVEEVTTPPIRRINTYPGETYDIKNISTKEYVIKDLQQGAYDYALYDTEGNLTEYAIYDVAYANGGTDRIAASLYNIAIPAGYTLKLTQAGTYAYYDDYYVRSICVLYDEFTVEKSDTPVAERIYIYPSETYTFKNIGNVSYPLISRSPYGYADYVMYDADGNIAEHGFDLSIDDKIVPAGYSIKMTLLEAGSQNLRNIAVPYGKFTVEKEADPVSTRLTPYRGEAYTIENISDEDCLLKGLPITCEYVMYDADGKVADYGAGVYMSTVTLPAGYSMNFVYLDRDVSEIKVLNEQCTFAQSDTAPMIRVWAETGEKYKFTNISSEAKTVSFGYHHYEIYSATGELIESEADGGYITNKEIPSGGYIIVWTGNTGANFVVLKEWFSVEAVTPAHNYLYFNDGQTYKFENTSNADKEISIGGFKYQSWDYIIFDSTGAMTSYDLNTTSGASPGSYKITLPAGAVAYATIHSSYYNILVLNEGIVATPCDETVDIDKLCVPNKIYKLTNTDTKTNGVEVDGESYDYVMYNSDGSIAAYENNSYKYQLSAYTSDYAYQVPAKGWILITSESGMRLSCLNQYFEVEELDGELFTTTIVEDGKTFSFRNTLLVDSVVAINKMRKGSSTGAADTGYAIYDYVIYYSDGTVYESEFYCEDDKITVPAKCTLVVTPYISDAIIDVLKDRFVISERSNPVYTKAEIGIDTETVFTNTTKVEKTLYLLAGGYVDYTTYNSRGEVVVSKESADVSSIAVPARGSVKITSRLNNFSAIGLYENFTYSINSIEPEPPVVDPEEPETPTLDTRVGGTQKTLDNGKKRLYLFAGIDSLDYAEVGFEVTAKGTTASIATTTVYNSISVTMNGNPATLTPSQFGETANYIFGKGIAFPATFGGERVTVKAYAKTKDGVKIYANETGFTIK